MYKKTIEFTDFNDVNRKEDFYFHLSRHELIDMQLSTTGGLEKYIEKIVQTQDSKKIYDIFKEIILKSYGVKSDDGLSFDKSERLMHKFENSAAFDALITEFMTNTDSATAFVNGIVPAMPADHKAAENGVIEFNTI